MRNNKRRVEMDIKKFYESINAVERRGIEHEAVIAAKKYCEDAKYFLEKGDLFTAFGCISYAHGLLDAVIKYGKEE
ncbi:MAG: DUF357 domain-containing protein [Candidatus Anstonellales archaeon]